MKISLKKLAILIILLILSVRWGINYYGYHYGSPQFTPFEQAVKKTDSNGSNFVSIAQMKLSEKEIQNIIYLLLERTDFSFKEFSAGIHVPRYNDASEGKSYWNNFDKNETFVLIGATITDVKRKKMRDGVKDILLLAYGRTGCPSIKAELPAKKHDWSAGMEESFVCNISSSEQKELIFAKCITESEQNSKIAQEIFKPVAQKIKQPDYSLNDNRAEKMVELLNFFDFTKFPKDACSKADSRCQTAINNYLFNDNKLSIRTLELQIQQKPILVFKREN